MSDGNEDNKEIKEEDFRRFNSNERIEQKVKEHSGKKDKIEVDEFSELRSKPTETVSMSAKPNESATPEQLSHSKELPKRRTKSLWTRTRKRPKRVRQVRKNVKYKWALQESNLSDAAKLIVDHPGNSASIMWIVINYRNFSVIAKGNGTPKVVIFKLNQYRSSPGFLIMRRKQAVRISKLSSADTSPELLGKRARLLKRWLSLPIESLENKPWTTANLARELDKAKRTMPSALSNFQSFVKTGKCRKSTMGAICYHENVEKTLKRLRGDKNSIDWMILDFPGLDDTDDEWLTMNVIDTGSGGPKTLREKLSDRNNQFALVKFMTHRDSRMSKKKNIYKYVCIVWMPTDSGKYNVQKLATLHMRKQVIGWLDEVVRGMVSLPLSEKSQVTRNAILCELNKKGLLKDLLIRVVTSRENCTQLIYIDRQLQVRSLKKRIGEEILSLDVDTIDLKDITLQIINDTTIYEESWFQNVARTFDEPPKVNKVLFHQDDERTLQNVGITFGCKIYADYDEKADWDDDEMESEWQFKRQTLAIQEMHELDDMVYNAESVTIDDLWWRKMDVARGRSAKVHQALLHNRIPVAVKEFRVSKLTKKIKKEYDSEIDVIKHLSRDISHPNVVKMVAMLKDYEAKKLFIILEWVGQGALYNFIRGPSRYSFLDVLKMSLDIAKGMEHLHSRQVIHRDLKTHNLLLDDLLNIKVTDFGTSKILDQATPTYTKVGSDGYTAPEIYGSDGYSYEVDLFSYAVILWELVDRGRSKNPLTGICNNYYDKVRSGVRPKIKTRIRRNCPQYVNLIQECWRSNPKERPSFKEVRLRLEKLSESKNVANIQLQSVYYQEEDSSSHDEKEEEVGCSNDIFGIHGGKSSFKPKRYPASTVLLPDSVSALPQPDAVVPLPNAVFLPVKQVRE